MTKGYEWAQAQYDRQEPFLPVCEGCGRTVDAVADIDGTRLCEACVSEWLLNHLDIMTDRIMSPASARIEKINTQIFIISGVIPLASAMGI